MMHFSYEGPFIQLYVIGIAVYVTQTNDNECYERKSLNACFCTVFFINIFYYLKFYKFDKIQQQIRFQKYFIYLNI